jgi:hypothetical protein
LGLDTGIILGKADFKTADNSLFIEDLMPTICCKPSGFKCSFRDINSTTDLNKIKSARKALIKGYLSRTEQMGDYYCC